MFAVLGVLAAITVGNVVCDYVHGLADKVRQRKTHSRLQGMCVAMEQATQGPSKAVLINPSPRLYLSEMEAALGEGHPDLYESEFGRAHGIGVPSLIQAAATAEARFRQLEVTMPHCSGCGRVKLGAS